MIRDIVPATPRRGMTPARRARILAAHDGRCAVEWCDVTDGLELDHIVPLELGGAETDANTEPLCRVHHRLKTDRDIKMIAKARRIRKREREGPPPPKFRPGRKLQGGGKLQSRGFDKRYTRRTDREVERT